MNEYFIEYRDNPGSPTTRRARESGHSPLEAKNNFLRDHPGAKVINIYLA